MITGSAIRDEFDLDVRLRPMVVEAAKAIPATHLVGCGRTGECPIHTEAQTCAGTCNTCSETCAPPCQTCNVTCADTCGCGGGGGRGGCGGGGHPYTEETCICPNPL